MDKMMLWGAWILMSAVGSLTAWRISQTPKVEPVIAMLEADLNRNPKVPRMEAPPAVPVWNNPFDKVLPLPRAAAPRSDEIFRYVSPPPPPPPVWTEVFVLPVAKVEAAKADLDGMTVTWSVQEAPQEKLPSHMTQKRGNPTGFVIRRQCEDGEPETLGKVGPEVRSFVDLSTEPRLTYRYWVLVTGEETNRTTKVKELVTKGLFASVEARTPSNVRMKLVGGAKENAFLKVETYDRTQKKWIPKTVMAAPGRDIGASGWTLKRLRFDNFTLVAEVTDDDGVDRVLSTKD